MHCRAGGVSKPDYFDAMCLNDWLSHSKIYWLVAMNETGNLGQRGDGLPLCHTETWPWREIRSLFCRNVTLTPSSP